MSLVAWARSVRREREIAELNEQIDAHEDELGRLRVRRALLWRESEQAARSGVGDPVDVCQWTLMLDNRRDAEWAVANGWKP